MSYRLDITASIVQVFNHRHFSSAFILVLYSLGLSSFLPPHIPTPFLFAFSSALLYAASLPPNSTPILASYVVASPTFSISSPTSLRRRYGKRRT